MSTTRRDFLGLAAGGAGVALATGLATTAHAQPEQEFDPGELPGVEKAAKPLRILILGGTGFIGPHQVRYALARGHQVTIFNRGRTRPDLFGADVEQRIGNRDPEIDDGLASLETGEWDAIIDNSAYVPRIAEASAQLLKGRAKRYVFVSSISAYADEGTPGIDESSPVATLEDTTVETVTGETYGALKAYCEQAVQDAFGAGATIVRPGYIVGPGDRSDRFTTWPVRIRMGGEVLAPGTPDDPIQWVDARDLSAFCVRLCEEDTAGVFNVAGPEADCSTAMMLYGIWGATSADVRFTWVPAAFLAAQQFGAPIWVDPAGPYAGFGRVSIKAAIDAGLTFRPLAETTRDLLAWWDTLPEQATQRLRDRLASGREQEVLAAWKAEQG
ncbi:MAG: NAD-dependent epimerase/dehydratase family protein [Phycisphaerales bacterium]